MEIAKIGEEPLMVLNFSLITPLIFKFIETTMLQVLQGNRKKMPEICRHGEWLAEFIVVVFYWLVT